MLSTPRLASACAPWSVGLLALIALFETDAHAVPPPNIPLPPCQTIDGVEYGACPVDDQGLRLSASGSASPGRTVVVTRNPDEGICNKWSMAHGENWSPFPCVSGFDDVGLLGCVSIDAFTGDIREDGCGQLFQSGGKLELTTERAGGGSCSGDGNFGRYVYGGAANQPGKTWAARAQSYKDCVVSFTGDEPDGLWGPTWMVMGSSVTVQDTPYSFNATSASGTVFVKVDGELRDLGPSAAFVLLTAEGNELTFENRSVHSRGESMTYQWSFGDGGTSSATDPVHVYDAPGFYVVELTATDQTGDESTYGAWVSASFELTVDVTVPEGPYAIGELIPVTVTFTNPFNQPVEQLTLRGPGGLRFDASAFLMAEAPGELASDILAPGESVSVTTTLVPVTGGELDVTAGADGRMLGLHIPGRAELTLDVIDEIGIALTSRATDTEGLIEVIATLTNPTFEWVEGVVVGDLTATDVSILNLVSGPLVSGDALDAPLSIGPAGEEEVTWLVELVDVGETTLTASATASDPRTGEEYTVEASARVVAEDPAIEVYQAVIVPSAVFPGWVHRLDVTVRNVGTVDVTDIEVTFQGDPPLTVLEAITAQDQNAPPIASLEPDGSRDVSVWFFTTTDTGQAWSVDYRIDISGTATTDASETPVTDAVVFTRAIDFTYYWSNLLGEVGQVLYDSVLPEVSGRNGFRSATGVGGYVEGCPSWARADMMALQRGDYTAEDLVDGDRLAPNAAGLVAVAREVAYTFTPAALSQAARSVEPSVGDDAGLAIADWCFALDAADAARDVDAVVALLTGPVDALGDSDVRVVAAGVIGRLMYQEDRRTLRGLVQPGSPLDKAAEPGAVPEAVDQQEAERRGMPTGVPLPDGAVAEYLSPEVHGWLRGVAREYGVAFFVSTRSELGEVLARKGFNAQTVAVNYLPVDRIDIDWLGFPETVEVPTLTGGTETLSSEGLVLMREPSDPEEALIAAIEDGSLRAQGWRHSDIVYRFNWRRAEHYVAQRQLAELGEVGLELDSFGVPVTSTAQVEDSGLILLDYDGLPVYADTGLVHVARPDGSALPADLHRRVSEVLSQGAGLGADVMATATAPDWDTARGRVEAMAARHARGGVPLLIIQPDATTLGYVRDVTYPDTAPTGAFYDLYGAVEVSYEGAALSCERP